MQRTDNFDLIVVEGSDTVNLLTQMNPNTEAIDEQMFKNQNAGVQTATELLSGTVHAITRSIPDASMIRFTAVSRFTAGDTFTVDGVQVSALLPSGEQLPDGAFIIGSEVLCVLKGTLLTVFASGGAVALARDAEKLGGELPSYYATKEEVDNAQSTASSAGSLAETNRLKIDNIDNALTTIEEFTLTDKTGGTVVINQGFYNEATREVKIVFLASNITLNGNTTIANIPMKYRPNSTRHGIGTAYVPSLSTTLHVTGRYSVASDGNINPAITSNTIGAVYCIINYFI